MTGIEIYKRTEVYERDAGKIRLHAPEWKLLLAFDGRRTLAEVALSAGASFIEALSLTEKFLARNWITEPPITLDQYLKRIDAPELAGIGAAASPVAPSRTQRGPMRLSAVVDFIISHADNALLGQLAAYRVFLRVPHELLQTENIVSINLANDSNLVRNGALQQAIAEAVHEIVKRPLPDSVFAVA